MKKIFILLIMTMVVMSSSLAFAAEPDATNTIADVVILRPLGLGALAIGTAVYVISLPIALITKSTEQTGQVLVKDPYEYVFVRPVGEIGSGL